MVYSNVNFMRCQVGLVFVTMAWYYEVNDVFGGCGVRSCCMAIEAPLKKALPFAEQSSYNYR